MTALKEYLRLESGGLWRDAPEAQRREVIVSFGDATLVLSDPRSNRALTHWSLPAVIRLNPGRSPALFSPAPDAGEELEIEDETMVAAITKVHRLIEARRPHPGRLRSVLTWGAVALFAAAGIFWLPGALRDHTAEMLPLTTRQDIGRAALADLTRLTGAPCSAPEGRAALDRLGRRLLGEEGEIFVLPDTLAQTRSLPGEIVLLPRALVEAAQNADALSGEVLAHTPPVTDRTELNRALRFAGLRATVGLLTTGHLSPDALAGYGTQFLRQTPPPALPDAALTARFAAAGLSAAPYAYARDPSGESTLALIEADPYRTGSDRPALSDADWVALQAICLN